jgi:hypothetical protein
MAGNGMEFPGIEREICRIYPEMLNNPDERSE